MAIEAIGAINIPGSLLIYTPGQKKALIHGVHKKLPFAEPEVCSPCPPASRPSPAQLNDSFVPPRSLVLTSRDQVCFFLHSKGHYRDPLTGELKPLFLLTMAKSPDCLLLQRH